MEDQTPARKSRKVLPQVEAARNPDAMLTVTTVAALTGFSTFTIREWARERRRGFPAAVYYGRNVRLRAGDVLAWMQAQGMPIPITLRA